MRLVPKDNKFFEMFGALASRGINIAMINTSEVRLSVVVARTRGEEALALLR